MNPFQSSGAERWQKAATYAAEMFPDANHMEHRWGVRRACKARVTVSAGGGASGMGRLRNISMSGAFLETALPLPLFAQVAVAVLREDGSHRLLDFPAVVVRHASDGVGLEWCDPDPGRICRKLGCGVECGYAEACGA